MGVNGVLNKILPAVGTKLDLRDLTVIDINKSTINEGPKCKISLGRRRVRAAVDISSWIAKACHRHGKDLVDERLLTNYGCAQLRRQSKNDEKAPAVEDRSQIDRYILNCAGFVMSKILLLTQRFDLMVVLDGQTPPIKQSQCNIRHKKRKAASIIRDDPNLAYISSGTEDMNEQIILEKLKAAQRAGAPPSAYVLVVEALISMLKKKNIRFIVSQYEADGQLAFLSKRRLVDLVITEDSDLIGYGALSILFKVDNDCKEGFFLERKNLGCCQQLDLTNFSDVMLATLFVASGCDYCHSLPGIGIVRAHAIVKKAFQSLKQNQEEAKTCALSLVLENLFQRVALSADKEKKEYTDKFVAALAMYRHPVVYDHAIGKCMFMGDPPNNSDPELMTYVPYAKLCSNRKKLSSLLGEIYPPDKSSLITEGWVNPKSSSLYKFDDIPIHIKETFRKTFPESVSNNLHNESPPTTPKSAKKSASMLDNKECNVSFVDNNKSTLSQSTGQSSSSSSKTLTQASGNSDFQSISSPDLLS